MSEASSEMGADLLGVSQGQHWLEVVALDDILGEQFLFAGVLD